MEILGVGCTRDFVDRFFLGCEGLTELPAWLGALTGLSTTLVRTRGLVNQGGRESASASASPAASCKCGAREMRGNSNTMEDDSFDGDFRRRDGAREPHGLQAEPGYRSSRHAIDMEDEDEVEVGCHGAKRPGDSRRSRQRLMLFVAVATGAMIFVPAGLGLLGYGDQVNGMLEAWLARPRPVETSAARGIKQMANTAFDQLSRKDCSFAALSKWASDQGIEHPKIHVAELPCPQCPSGKRRGVTAKERIQKGEAIVRAPWAATVNAEHAPSAALVPVLEQLRNATRLQPADALALVLLYERFNAESRLHPWLCFLPTEHEGPIFWDDAALAKLGRSSELAQRVGFFRSHVREQYDKILPLLVHHYPHMFNPDVHTPAAWLWAHAMVDSRNWFVNLKRPPAIKHAMIPVNLYPRP
jgi:hypothetical protein